MDTHINMSTVKSEVISESECGSDVETPEKAKLVQSSIWSPEERALLLASVKQFGMLNVEYLASIVQTKTVSQIKEFFEKVSRAVKADQRKKAEINARLKLARYKRNGLAKKLMTRSKPQPKQAPLRKFWNKLLASEMGNGPIDWWLNYVEVIMKTDCVKRPLVAEMIPRAFSVIAQYEAHPHPSLCGGVDYREAYDFLYHVLSGVPPKSLLPTTALFLQRSIRRLLLSLNDVIHSPEYSDYFGAQMHHLQAHSASTERNKLPGQTYGANSKGNTPKRCYGLVRLSHAMKRLMCDASFNPLMVPEILTWKQNHVPNILKPTDTRTFKPVDSTSNVGDVTSGLFSETNIHRGHRKTPRI